MSKQNVNFGIVWGSKSKLKVGREGYKVGFSHPSMASLLIVCTLYLYDGTDYGTNTSLKNS